MLMDNCSEHIIPEIFTLLGENHIKAVTLTPDTTDIFAALDFSFFGVFKNERELLKRSG
jgi:hypothetical protein